MDRDSLINQFLKVRGHTEKLVKPLAIEDYVVQPIEDVSPPKWHIGHTTWFFERVVLQQYKENYRPFDERYYYIFNSYYETFGERVMRSLRGTLSRPTVEVVMDYRKAITERTAEFMKNCSDNTWNEIELLIKIGINHEQQHQELFLMDIKNIYASNPLQPQYSNYNHNGIPDRKPAGEFLTFAGGMHEIGADGTGFAYDNEFPRHKVYLHDFKLARNLVSCGEFLEFIDSGGYEKATLWLSDGWAAVQENKWNSPLYWEKDNDGWKIMTLNGLKPLDPNEPVSHVSHYEADAFARWAGKRLPTEEEWEIAAGKTEAESRPGSFMDDNTFHPVARKDEGRGLNSMYGDVWEWTQSAYLPYPGYKQAPDALGEYNAKFMNNQMVLRGGCCATPRDHFRPTYRNFFQSDKRWPYTGFRLAEDA